MQNLGNGGSSPDGDDPLSQFFRRFQVPNQSPERIRPSRGVGSGFINVSTDACAQQRARDQDAAEVIVALNDRREFAAKVIGVDKGKDVALIKIPRPDYPR